MQYSPVLHGNACNKIYVLQTEMYSVMTVSSEPPGSLGWLSFTLVLKSAFAVIWLKCVSVAIISIEPPRL